MRYKPKQQNYNHNQANVKSAAILTFVLFQDSFQLAVFFDESPVADLYFLIQLLGQFVFVLYALVELLCRVFEAVKLIDDTVQQAIDFLVVFIKLAEQFSFVVHKLALWLTLLIVVHAEFVCFLNKLCLFFELLLIRLVFLDEALSGQFILSGQLALEQLYSDADLLQCLALFFRLVNLVICLLFLGFAKCLRLLGL